MDVPAWWEELTRGYVRYLRRNGRDARYCRQVGGRLVRFGGYLTLHHVDTPEGLTREVVEEWCDDLVTMLHVSSAKIVLSSIRGLLKWAAGREETGISPRLWLTLPSIRTRRRLPRPIRPDELLRLQEHFGPPPLGKGLPAWRDRALFWVMFSSAARLAAVLQLDRSGEHAFTNAQAIVVVKFGHEANLITTQHAYQTVVEYLSLRSDDEPAIFVRHWGAQPLRRLTHAAVGRIWTRTCRELGIRRFTSHQLRHTCLTTLANADVSVLDLVQHAGHANMQTILNYIELASERRRRTLSVLEPPKV